MAEILHQLIGRLSHYLQGLYIPGGAGFQPSTVGGFFSLRNTWHFRPGKLTDFDSSLMAPSMALVARDLRFVDQNVAEPPGGRGRRTVAVVGVDVPTTTTGMKRY